MLKAFRAAESALTILIAFEAQSCLACTGLLSMAWGCVAAEARHLSAEVISPPGGSRALVALIIRSNAVANA